jgi:GGDEF domain-containing protein
LRLCRSSLVASKTPLAASQRVPFIGVYLREAGPVLEAKRLMEHLRENALRDPLTGLYNRRFLEDYVGTLVSSSQRRKSPFAVLMLDLDYFKQVNDTHGHEAGDKVIKTLADLLVRSLRASDMAVRYGGEEFLLVLTDTVSRSGLDRRREDSRRSRGDARYRCRLASCAKDHFDRRFRVSHRCRHFLAGRKIRRRGAVSRRRIGRAQPRTSFRPHMWDAEGSY